MSNNKNLGLWNNVVNPETGENSITEHKPKLIIQFCKQQDHYFELISPTSRQLKCKKCSMETYFILGLQQLIDGKVINQHS